MSRKADQLERQQRLHEAIEACLADGDDLDDGELLVGWVLIYETTVLGDDERGSCGHFYGPREMTTWRALGLVEWARRFSLVPHDEDDG